MENLAGKQIMDRIIENILESGFDDIDDVTLAHAKNRIIDVVGCLIGGAGDSGNSEFVELIRDIGGKPESTIMVYGHKVPVHNAAMVNSILARSFDFEPVSPAMGDVSFPGHVSGSTVMTALTMGEMKHANGKELIIALLLGDDLATRVLHSAGFEFSKGWDNIGTVNAFGTTAIAGRLFGLDKRQLAHAFGIVLNQLAGSMQIVWDTTTSFKICQGLSSRNGIFSARLAGIDWTAPEDALFSNFGYYNLYTEGCKNPDALTDDLGKKYHSDQTFKPYPCCRITHAAIDSALAVASANEIPTDEIEEIRLGVSKIIQENTVAQPFTIGPFPHASAAFNIRYTVACAILNRGVRPEHFTEKTIRDSAIYQLITKVRLEDLDEGGSESARVTVRLKNGGEYSAFTDIAKGDPRNPVSKDELLAKFWTNVDFGKTVSREKAQEFLAMVDNLETVDDIATLTGLLV